MSTVARGGSRGGRGRGVGAGAGAGVWRGGSARGGLNGASSDSNEKPALGAKKRGGGGAPVAGKTRSHAQEVDEDGKPKSIDFVPMNKYGTAENSTPHAKDDYTRRFDYLQRAQPSWRKQLQEKRLMNPDGQMKLQDSVKLIGRCDDMCPEYERVRRIAQKDYKRPECTTETEHLPYNERVPDESRMVKAFTRSSAGADVELVIDIRNPAACLKTVKYLFGRLDHEGFDYLHAWIWDRTRSVRKDLRTQVVEKPADIRTLLVCLEASARFYLLSMHQMAQTAKEDYSHQQDMEQFNQTLTTLRERYDDNRRAGIPSDNEAEFVAYRLILASIYANSQLENELHSLPNDLRNNKRVLTAIDIFKAAKSAFNFGSDKSWVQAQANWKKFWALVRSPSVSYLMACAAEVGFNRVRHVILDSIWHAYRRGGKGDIDVQAWTTDQLQDVLAMDDEKDAVKLCELFGFHFERNPEGRTYLDISKLGNSNRSLGVPHTIKPQMFSHSLVESKRHNRAFSAIIQGLTVQQARTGGLLVDPSTRRHGVEDSLFIPEATASAPKTNIFGQFANGKATNGASTFNPNPFAKPSQSSSQTLSSSSAPNPFGGNASLGSQSTQVTSAPSFGGSGLSTTFDATRNSIKFAPTPVSNTNNNPFVKTAATLPPQSTPTTSRAPESPNFGFNTAPTFHSQLPPTPATSAISATNGQSAPGAGKPFVFPGLPELNARIKNGELAEVSTTPAGSPQQPDAAAKAAAKEKAEADARAAVLKQKQEAEELRKREQQEQERRAREAQQAREAEQRRIDEEKQHKLAEQQQRELRARQERERLIQEEQQRRQQEEQERQVRIRRRELAFDALTSTILYGGEEGLLYQFLENTIQNLAAAGHKEWQAELQRKRETEEREVKRKAFARAVFTHWVAQVQKKKRNAKAKERRKRLKAQRQQTTYTGEGEGEAASEVPTESVASTDGASTTQSAPTNDRRARRIQERSGSAAANHKSITSHPRVASSRQPQTSSGDATVASGHHVRSYSEAYHKAATPIDRTETDWFKLRAMGIDPSKHRKRSFDSATDEDKVDAEAKRLRRSDSTASLMSQQPPEPEGHSKPLTIEERLARIRATKQSLRLSGSGSPPVNGATPTKRSSFTGRASQIIAQARDLISKSPVAKKTFSPVRDFRRSVPDLSASTSSFRSSTFGKSLGTETRKPAYWARASRFVPQHLYGKGPDAIREYRDKYVNSPTGTPRPLSMEPLALSSPIPTQFSYVPQPGSSQPQYSESGSASGVDLVNVDADDNIAGDTEEDSFYGDDEDVGRDEDEEEEEEEDEEDDAEEVDEDEEADDPTQIDTYSEQYNDQEEYTEEEDLHFAQPGSSFGAANGPGATQDDAIELSD